MNKGFASLLGCIPILLAFQSAPALAAVDAALAQGIATALGGKAVGDIINDVRLSGVTLIDQATQSGNALIARSGNEASVLAENLNSILKEDMNIAFDRLSEERKMLLIEAEAMRRSLASTTDAAYSFKDSTMLDLNALATSLPFVKNKFFVQSIKGIAYLPQAADFKMKIAATTLGIQEDVRTDIEVLKGTGSDAQPLPSVLVDQSKARFFADVSIPNELLSSEFDQSSLKIVPLTIRFKTTRNKGWWIFSTSETKIFDVPINISLFPRSAGHLTAHTKSPSYAWVSAGTQSVRYGTPNRNCTKKCKGEPTRGSNRIEFAVSGGAAPFAVGNKRLKNPRQSAVGGNNGFSDSFNLRLTDNDTRLIFTWDTWSTSGTWEASADVEEYRVIGETSGTSELAGITFGRALAIIVPKDMTYGLLRITTFTKQQYEINISQPDPYGLLAYQGTSSAGPDTSRVTYRVNDPALVSPGEF
ncbi:hypothetical protein [Pseudomonas sp. NFACC07-1]|uniref:hypothetical protein n=1 Tax=Pseudomonas sp. NFACC07-1 TaxID=1566239 RepID=UPI0008B8BD7E|nr:hypothetical protein [Pseudomonas sp. NFACC07-1]SEJ91488.1 hypothetical protein SAMN03159298_05053 [Pseudomonas sp. NFACC07-1]